MYKVFINEHLIILSDRRESLDYSLSFMEVYNPDSQEIIYLTQWLLKEQSQQQLVLLAEDLDQLWREFNSSFQFIEAAGGLVENEDGKTLMIYRLQKWDLPKGKIEKGEMPKEAAIREVEEECNLDGLEIKSELPSSYHIYQQADSIILKRTYWYKMFSSSKIQLIPQAEEGIEKVEWMDSNEKKKAALNTYPSLQYLLV